ncbi:AraD1 family protein [Collimonas antrihumi]|uniref:AraD1 family protein n=1 Tax=Collimonas antrihumi TaxID=1940615 RepID=UPI001B8CFBE2|nr:AraD1 family protein [Collimonas antrihumi]
MLLVQFKLADGQRRIGVLEDEGRKIHVVDGYASTYELAQAAIESNSSLQSVASAGLGAVVLDYAEVAKAGRLLPPLDHSDSAHCYVTGTGLTHLGSADGRDAMHKKINDVDTLTDSMKMFRMGLEGGKPQPGQTGVQPEWFYKGDGSIVCAGEQPLTMPQFALDGGEEPEIAALYVIAADGTPCRLGFAIGNEFSDHVTERQNYLYLAHSKLRVCAVGPALLIGDLPSHVEGMSRIRSVNGQVRWEKPFVSGEENMSHTVANLEYHHFKYPLFRRPGDVHIHFFGTATLSCSDGIQVAPGETFEIDVAAFGPPLRNRLAVETLATPRIRPL